MKSVSNLWRRWICWNNFPRKSWSFFIGDRIFEKNNQFETESILKWIYVQNIRQRLTYVSKFRLIHLNDLKWRSLYYGSIKHKNKFQDGPQALHQPTTMQGGRRRQYPAALVLAPTRELSLQVCVNTLRRFPPQISPLCVNESPQSAFTLLPLITGRRERWWW